MAKKKLEEINLTEISGDFTKSVFMPTFQKHRLGAWMSDGDHTYSINIAKKLDFSKILRKSGQFLKNVNNLDLYDCHQKFQRSSKVMEAFRKLKIKGCSLYLTGSDSSLIDVQPFVKGLRKFG